MAEWSIAAVLKTVEPARVPGVRIPLSPFKIRSTSKIVEWEKKKRAKRIKNVLQCPMC